MTSNWFGIDPYSAIISLFDQLLVLLRSQEAAKGVLLHQSINSLLGQVKGHRGKINQVPQGHILGVMINVHLSGSLGLDEVLIDLPGLHSHLHGRLGLLEVLAGHPELNVLLTEFRAQEATEHGQATAVGQHMVQGLTPLRSLLRNGLLKLLWLLLWFLWVWDDQVNAILRLLEENPQLRLNLFSPYPTCLGQRS